MIKDPVINALNIREFTPHGYGGNAWWSKEGEKELRFTTTPSDGRLKSMVKIQEWARDGGLRVLAIVHFDDLDNQSKKAVDVVFGMSDTIDLQEDHKFEVGNEAFSKKWIEPVGIKRSVEMAWNNEKPPIELAIYSAKEITYGCLKILNEYDPERLN